MSHFKITELNQNERKCLLCGHINDDSTSKWYGCNEQTKCAECGKWWWSAIRYEYKAEIINPDHVIKMRNE